MGDDTKYAVIWPETEARLSQRASLNDRASSTTFPDGIFIWQEDVCIVCLLHFTDRSCRKISQLYCGD